MVLSISLLCLTETVCCSEIIDAHQNTTSSATKIVHVKSMREAWGDMHLNLKIILTKKITKILEILLQNPF